jgi:hypothetical protein
MDVVHSDTSDEDLDEEPNEPWQRDSSTLSNLEEAEVKQILFAEPSKVLLALLSEGSPNECHKKTSIWIREQKLQGRLASLTKANEKACQCWVEQMRWQWLRELFRELESLRTYRLTEEEDIRCAVRSINAAMASSMRFSHH